MTNKRRIFSWIGIGFISLWFSRSVFPQVDLPEAGRDQWQQPEKIMDAVGVKPGMTIGEAGAGEGYFTFKLAARVGIRGLIYANDIKKSSLDIIEKRCRKEGVRNIRIIRGSVNTPHFPARSLDMAIMVYVLHDLEKPAPFLENIIPALKPGAPLIIVDQDPEKTGSKTGHFWVKGKVVRTVIGAGYELHRIETFLSRDNIYIFFPKE